MILLGQRILTKRDPIGPVTPLLKIFLSCHFARINVESHSPIERSCTLWLSTLSSFLHTHCYLSLRNPVQCALPSPLRLSICSCFSFRPKCPVACLVTTPPRPSELSCTASSSNNLSWFFQERGRRFLFTHLSTALFENRLNEERGGGTCYPFLCVWCIIGTP